MSSSAIPMVMPPSAEAAERKQQILEYLKEALEKAEAGKLSSIMIYHEKWDGTYEIHISGCQDAEKMAGSLLHAAMLRLIKLP